jgi:hypothetical protein
MHWNEKIDLIKKEYSDKEFSVPMVNRKDILRKFEIKLLTKPKDCFHLNNYRGPFLDWWENHNGIFYKSMNRNIYDLLENILNKNDSYWVGCEFGTGVVFIYKSKLHAIQRLISIGLTWCGIFHICSLKFEYSISFKITESYLEIKAKGVNGLNEKIYMDKYQ